MSRSDGIFRMAAQTCPGESPRARAAAIKAKVKADLLSSIPKGDSSEPASGERWEPAVPLERSSIDCRGVGATAFDRRSVASVVMGARSGAATR